MIALKRHVIAVVAALFALAAGIAIGGGPLSYVQPDEDEPSSSAPDEAPTETPTDESAPVAGGFADQFAATAAATLYDAQLFGHPTAILAMPGADEDVIEGMRTQVKAAGGGLTGVFEVGADAVDISQTSVIDELGSQLVEQLSDDYNNDVVDPEAPTYVRLGQLIGMAMATPVKDGGLKAKAAEEAVRAALAEADLLTSPEGTTPARLAPLVLVVLPEHDAKDDDFLAKASVFRAITVGLSESPAGAVIMGDTASAESGILKQLREDDDVTSVVSTVDGSDTGVGQVTAMLALIKALDGSVGSYGASGSDGVPSLS